MREHAGRQKRIADPQHRMAAFGRHANDGYGVSVGLVRAGESEAPAAFDDYLSTATPFDDRRKAFHLHLSPLTLSGDHQHCRQRDGKTP